MKTEKANVIKEYMKTFYMYTIVGQKGFDKFLETIKTEINSINERIKRGKPIVFCGHDNVTTDYSIVIMANGCLVLEMKLSVIRGFIR